MRISDWSSDVCSSDLLLKAELGKFGLNGTDGVGPGVSSGLGIGAVCFQPLAKLLVSHLLPSSATHASVLTSRRCSTLLASSSSSFGLATMSASVRARLRSEEQTSELQSVIRN